MSDDDTQPAPQGNQPNWGSAYPPPGQPTTPPGVQYPPPGQQYPPPGYGYPPPGQQYPPPGYGYPQFAPQPPKHEKATTAMVLGIVGVAGIVTCYLPLLISPFAWVMGSRAVKQIDASNGALGGRSEAKAGMVLGIIGTVILVLALALVVVLVVLSITVDDFWDDDSGSYYYDDTFVRGAFSYLGSALGR